jgi:hypothetical protein
LTSILHSEPRSRVVLAQSPWIETGPSPSRPSAVRFWLTIAASCLASFAAGWAIQVFLVPLALQQVARAPVATPQIAPPAAIPPSATSEIDGAQPKPPAPPPAIAPVPQPIPPVAVPVPHPTADFANRPRARFVAGINAATNIAPGLELSIARIEAQRIDASLRTGSTTLPVRAQALLQIIPVDPATGVDIIFTAADERSVTGYVLFPKP